MVCPNKNSKEWKELVSRVGEFNAYRIFILNNNSVPENIEQSIINSLGGFISNDKALAIFKMKFPEANDSQLKFIKRALNSKEPFKYYSEYSNGTILLDSYKESVSMFILFHEIAHKYYNEFTSPELKEKLQKELKEIYGDSFNELQIEELIADQYAIFKTKKIPLLASIKEFIDSLFEFLGFIKSNNKELKKFFNQIDTRNRSYSVEGVDSHVERRFIAENFDNDIQLFKVAKKYVAFNFGRLLNSQEGLAKTKNEVRFELFHIIKNKALEYSNKQTLSPNELLLKKALEKLSQIKNKKPFIYDKILEDLFPYWDFSKFDSLIFDYNKETEELETVNISEYEIAASDEIDLSQNLTASVKDFLGNIVIEKGNRKTIASFSDMYIRTISLFRHINSNDSEDFVRQIRSALKKEGFNVRNEAIVNKVIDLFTKATSVNYESNGQFFELNPKYRFWNENTFYYTDVEDLNLFNITTQDLLNGLRDGTIKQIKRNYRSKFNLTTEEFNSDFFNRVSKELNIPLNTLNVLWKKESAASTFRELYAHFDSQTERILMLGKEEYVGGVNKHRFTEASYAGSKQSIQSDILSSIKGLFGNFTREDYLPETYEDKSISKRNKLFNKAFKKGFNKLKESLTLNPNTKLSLEEKEELLESGLTLSSAEFKLLKNVEDFFNTTFNSKYLGELVSVSNYKEIADILVNILDVIESSPELGNKLTKEEENENEDYSQEELSDEEFYDIDDLLEEDSMESLFKSLTTILEKNDNYRKASSIFNLEGVKSYLYVLGSQATEVFDSILQFNSRKDFSKLPGFLRQSFFAKYNIFLNGLNKIHSFKEYGGTKKGNFSNMYAFESEADFLHRNLSKMFITAFKHQGKDFKYYHQSYTPSNKKNVKIFNVNVLNNKEVVQGIELMLNQILDRNTDIEKLLNRSISNSFNNAEILETAIKEVLQVNKITTANLNTLKEDSKLKKQVIDKAHQNLKKGAESLAKYLIESQVDFDITDKARPSVAKVIKYFNEDLSQEELEELASKYNNITNKTYSKDGSRSYNNTVEGIKPLVDVFYSNWYINSYFLNQLASNDYSFFKNSLDLVKRMTGVYGPGLRPTSGFGNTSKHKFRTLVFEDIEETNSDIKDFLAKMISDNTFSELQDKLNDPNLSETERINVTDKYKAIEKIASFYPSDYKITDGQGFHTMARTMDLQMGYGSSFNVGRVLKPLIYDQEEVEIEKNVNGEKVVETAFIPRMIKYSTAELSTELDKFPKFKKLRENMEKHGIDQIVFNSGVKVGNPNKTLLHSFNDWTTKDINSVNPKSVLNLQNKNFRIQFDPEHHIESLVPNPTQMPYFLNILGTNEALADNYYKHLSKLINLNFSKFQEIFTLENENGVKEILKKATEGSGSELVNELLNAGVDFNLPTIVNKAIIQLSAFFENKVLKVKLPGSKFVLVADPAIEVKGKPLQFRVENVGNKRRIFAEVLLPKSYMKDVQVGDFLNGDYFAYRIPTSEMHSGLSLRVVGFYDSKETNIIVAPRQIVALHGSDFDIDALFVLKRTKLNKTFYTDANHKDTIEKIYNRLNELNPEREDIKAIKEELNSIKEEVEKEKDLIIKNEKEQEEFNIKSLSAFNNSSFKAKSKKRFGESYDEEKNKISYAKIHNLYYDPKSKNWSPILDSLAKKKELIEKLLTQKEINEEVKDLINQLQKIKLQDKKFPIGFVEEDGYLVLDNDFENKIKTLQKDLIISKEESEELLDAYYKNVIVETLMTALSSETNIQRNLNPITLNHFNAEDDSRPSGYEEGSIFDYLYEQHKIKVNKKGGDLSNILETLKTFRSNMDGSILTGVVANTMKSYAYMLRSGSKESEYSRQEKIEQLKKQIKLLKKQEDSKEKIKELENKIKDLELTKLDKSQTKTQLNKPIVFNGQTLDSIQENKGRLWMFLDSLLNAAIDNVKEQILGNLNINGTTINFTTVSLALGIAEKDVVSILQHPLVLELSKRANKTLGINELKGLIKKEAETEFKNYDFKSEYARKNFLDSIKSKVDPSKTFSEYLSDIKGNTSEYIAALALLDFMSDIGKIGEDVSSMATLLNILKEMPRFPKDIYKFIENFAKIGTLNNGEFEQNPSFSFNIENLFKVLPHLSSAAKVTFKLYDTIKANFIMHHDSVDGLVEDLQSSIKLKNKSNRIENQEEIRKAFSKFLISSLYPTFNEEPIKVKGTNITYTGTKAWIYKFIEKVNELKNSGNFNNNAFFRNLSTATGKYRNDLKFSAGADLSSEDVLEIITSFEAIDDTLYPGLKQDFVKYAVLKWGLDFGSGNFSVFLGNDLLKEVSDKVKSIFVNSVNDPDTLQILKDIFEIQLAVSTDNKIKGDEKNIIRDVTVKDGNQISSTRKGWDNTLNIFYDLILKTEGEQSKIKEFPKFISRGGGKNKSIFILVDESLGAYQMVGNVNTNSYFNLNLSSLLNLNYDLNKSFNPNVAHYKLKTFEEEIYLKTNINLPPIGTIVNMSLYNDPARQDMKTYEYMGLVDRVENDITTKKAYFKLTNEQPIYVDTLDSFELEKNEKEIENEENLIHSDSLRVFFKQTLTDAKKKTYKFNSKEVYEYVLNNSKNEFTIEFLKHFKDKLLTEEKEVIINLNDKTVKNGRILGDYNSLNDQIRLFSIGVPGHNVEQVYIHELVHLLTVDNLNKFATNPSSLTGEQIKAIKQLNILFRKIKVKEVSAGVKLSDVYGFTNIKEFLSEGLSNPDFQKTLRSYTVKGSKITIYDKFKNLIKSILGLPKEYTDNAFDTLISLSGQIIEYKPTSKSQNLKTLTDKYISSNSNITWYNVSEKINKKYSNFTKSDFEKLTEEEKRNLIKCL